MVWLVLFFTGRLQASKKKWFVAPLIDIEYWFLYAFVFFQVKMLLFATNQTNFKQKQMLVFVRLISIGIACMDGLGYFHEY